MPVSRHINSVCDLFEAEWNAGRTPSVADFVVQVESHSRAELVQRLIPLDVSYRFRNGIALDPADYSELGAGCEQLAVDEVARHRSNDPAVTKLDATVLVADSDCEDQSLIDSVQVTGSTLPPTLQAASPSDTPPRQIGRYHIVQELSSGGQGRVYRALHPNMPLEVAIKVSVNAAKASTHDALMEESRILCDLQHPHIARILDVDFDQEDHPFVVLEYVRGLSLQQKLKSDSFSQTAAIELIETLATALEYAHQRGVLHLDLKPGNIVFDESNQPRIIDFGLAKIRSAWTDNETPAYEISGTPAYMSPEQANGRQDLLDRRSDQFSLAAILYEILTGDRLYAGEVQKQIRDAQRGNFSSQPLQSAGVPAGLQAVCLKALSIQPEDRFETVTEFSQALRETAVSEGRRSVAAAEPAQIDPVHGSEDRRTWATRPVVLLGLAMALIALGSFWFRDTPEESAVAATVVAVTDAESAVRPLELDVQITHSALNQDGEIAASDDLLRLSDPRENDYLRWDVIPSQPAYFMLIALNPDGAVQTCFPERDSAIGIATDDAPGTTETNPSEPISEFHYPIDRGQGWGLWDGTGQQAFLLIASLTPLPESDSMVTLAGISEWTPKSESGAWKWKGGDLFAWQENQFRGGVSDLPGKSSFQEICTRLQKLYPDAEIHAVSFPIQSAVESPSQSPSGL